MAIELNHTIADATDAEVSARWLADMLGLDEPNHAAPFWEVKLANGVGLDFVSVGDDDVVTRHYAFLISEDEFDEIHGRLMAGGHEIWADPHQHLPGEINHHDGGRGMYFLSNDGHWLEVITRPYGGF